MPVACHDPFVTIHHVRRSVTGASVAAAGTISKSILNAIFSGAARACPDWDGGRFLLNLTDTTHWPARGRVCYYKRVSHSLPASGIEAGMNAPSGDLH